MKGKGNLSSTPKRHLAIIVTANLTWLGLLCLLVGWWWRLLLRQAGKIAELERALGWSVDSTQNQWHRTQRMLFWESTSFFILLLACTSLLFWLYWRDVKRARGLQAFFASVTHELRTPLTSIRLQAESIADSLIEKPAHGNLVKRLLEDTIRLEAQVERTLELARVEGGGPVYIQSLELKPWLDRFLKLWASDYMERVEFRSQVEDVVVAADPTALQIILKNIFENSVKHSKQEKVQVTLASEVGESRVVLTIQDNGQGYTGDRKSLGKVFQKGPSSQGTGVGLYLVQVLMRRMGGEAQFEPDSGFKTSLQFREGKQNG